MTAFVTDGTIGSQVVGENSSIQKHELGKISMMYDATTYRWGEYIYLKGVASTVVGSVVTYAQDDMSTALLVADAIGSVALSMGITVASEFGWYQIGGKGVAKVKTGFADNANCYGTSTAGSIDDAIVAGDLVKNMKGASAIDTPSTGLAEIELFRPFVDDGLTP